MLARKKTSVKGKIIPHEWTESLARLLNETYKTECKKTGHYFDIYAQIYPEELLLITSFLNEKDEAASPITLFLSCEADQISSEKKMKDTQNNLVEIIGLFFDEIFANPEWDEFEPSWQEVTHKKETYLYKISRENINLSLEANKLLAEDFLEQEADTELDQ